MAVISIVGTSGVGKSFLVKQLAALECAPAFFEGEEGVIPEDVFESIFSKKDPVKRYKWFIDNRKKILERAIKISKSGITCYVDGATMTAYAVMIHEDKKHHDDLKKIIESVDYLQSDIIVLIIADEKKLREFIVSRGRSSEQIDEALKRALRIQGEFVKLAKKEKNAIIIDRSKLDFSKEEDLEFVLDKIKKAPTFQKKH